MTSRLAFWFRTTDDPRVFGGNDDEESVISVDDFGGGDTKLNYLPSEPRVPAPIEIANLIEPHSTKPLSIAEAFQGMLRSAYRAGTAAAQSGETFEMWYEREVLK